MSLPPVASAPSSNELFQTPGISQKAIGDRLKAVNADQFKGIARKMVEVLVKNVNPSNNPLIQIPQVNPSTGKTVLVQGKDAKTEFLAQVAFLFEQRMKEDFQRGVNAFIVQGVVSKYSFKDMLYFCTEKAGYTAIRQTIGEDLARKPHYTISLSLDFDQTAQRSDLVFQVTEYNGTLELSKVSFSLREI